MRFGSSALLLVLLSPWNAIGQSDAVVHQLFKTSVPPAAMRHGLRDVLLLANGGSLELTDDQRSALLKLGVDFKSRLNALYAETDALLAGKTRISTDDLKELSRLRGPELRSQVRDLEFEIEENAKTVLLPHQLDLAREIMFSDRLYRFGLLGLMSSKELGVSFDRTADEMLNELSSKQSESLAQIDELMAEYQNNPLRVSQELLDLKRQQLDAAIKGMGTDGKKLRQLLEQVSEFREEMRLRQQRQRRRRRDVQTSVRLGV